MNLQGVREGLKYEGQTVIGTLPPLFFPIVRYRRRNRPDPHWLKPDLTAPDTDIVIEGFPRSGNTFAVVAFQISQPQRLKVAHHHHAPAQVLRAVQLGLPALVLLRDAPAAVVSLHLRQPELSLARLLRGYIRFHRPLLPHVSSLSIATFDEVISDFGGVVDRLNQQAQTRFTRFDHTSDNVAQCFTIIEERNSSLSGGTVAAHAVARPTATRDGDKARVRDLLGAPGLAPLLDTARSLHQRLLEART